MKRLKRQLHRVLWLTLMATGLTACASYYQQHLDFNYAFENGDLKQALAALQKNDGDADGKARFVYFVNRGLLLSVMGQYAESNDYFEKAFLFGEDYRINYFNEAASYLTNPNMTVYRGEDHEHLMLLYFKAINYLKMNKPEEALVECRRLNIRVNQLNDKYTAEEKLQRDAFIHTLMGIIYQSTKDYNNAFIAYRNAVEVYENDYARMFQLTVPEQLKKDLLDAAWYTGFHDEFDQFKTKFDMPDYVASSPDASLVFFWHNGLSPVKQEWSVNFVIAPGANNMMVFTSDALGMSFPYHVDDADERRDLSDLHVFRVAFPKYAERPPYYTNATIKADSAVYPLQLAEDINAVAFQSLKQRMLEEFTRGLVRAALKKAAEQSLRKKDDRLGAVLGLVNAMTEKADTRNWQTLPHSIFYTRVPLKEGETTVTLSLQTPQDQHPDYTFTYTAKKGQTLFHTFSSLEALPAVYRYY